MTDRIFDIILKATIATAVFFAFLLISFQLFTGHLP